MGKYGSAGEKGTLAPNALRSLLVRRNKIKRRKK